MNGRRPRRLLRTLGALLASAFLVTAGVGWWAYRHLDGNIEAVPLDGRGGAARADSTGRTPVNILVIGSDGRTSEADCALGGGCARTGVQSGQNADVELLVHLSADRSNATVMSIPRDTVTRIPACEDAATGASEPGYRGQINSALRYGPACQVAAVHQLTGIPVDHFVQLDFAGVVTMSDAVGGVPVCVSDNVYDTYSHLKLAKGTHTLKGTAALEFVRSRHGFGDGSDLGRTLTQHLFLSAMIRQVKSAHTLANPAALYRLADAATKALTVDDGLGSVRKLAGLAVEFDKVPARRITFVTLQTDPDPADADRVVVAPGAQALLSAIADDRSLTTGADDGPGTPSATAPAPRPASSVPRSETPVSVENGTGIPGRAAAVASFLGSRGFGAAGRVGNAPAPAATSTLTYGPGLRDRARDAAAVLGLPGSRLEQGDTAGLTLVIGADWPRGDTFPGAAASAPADSGPAVAHAHAETADRTGQCAEVSPYRTVTLDGIVMTPSQAYARASGVPDSDA